MKAGWVVKLPEGISTRQAMAVGTAGIPSASLVMIAVVLGAVLIPAPVDAGQETPSLVTVFESGGIGDLTMAEVADLGGAVYEQHSGTLRMISVVRGDEPIQTFPPGMGVPMSVSSWDPAAAAALLEDVEMVLAKADMGISERYAELADERTARVFGVIRAEFDRTVELILRLKGADELLAHDPTLQRAIRLRNPYVDPINLVQIELLHRLRELAGDSQVRVLY